MIRTLIMLGFWAVVLPLTAAVLFPWTILTGNVNLLYRVAMWGAFTGVGLTGVRVQTIGLDKLDASRTCIFMSIVGGPTASGDVTCLRRCCSWWTSVGVR